VEAERLSNSTKWKQRVASTYRSPEQLAAETEEKLRMDKQAAAAQREAEAQAAQRAAGRFLPPARRRQLLSAAADAQGGP
jgi:hypothetical protein